MNNCVPDFEIEMDDDEYPTPMSSGFLRSKKVFQPQDGIMELVWDNGPVEMHTQNQRPLRKPPPPSDADDVIPSGPCTVREIRPSQQVGNYHNPHLFMQEDEMTPWLHYPIVDDCPLDHNFCADLLYSPPTVNNSNHINNSATQAPVVTELQPPSKSVAPRPPIPPTRRRDQQVQTKIHDSVHFSNLNARVEAGQSSSKTVARESTVVDSCDTPAVAASKVSETIRSSAEPTEGDPCHGSMSTTGIAAPSTTSGGGGTGGREAMTCEMTVTSSPGGSSDSAEPDHRFPAKDGKRKGREAEDSECQSEDVDYESAERKKKVRGSTSTKRSRAAEVHNLSERRRRDRINEKMRALQELIPRCNKSDKASMLDEAIEYLKSLQLQVQMMSMGYGMVPMMFPGMQQYMPAMGMGMGMNRPVMPFPNMVGRSALPAATHLGPRFPVPPFLIPHVPAPDLSRSQPPNHSDNNNMISTSDPTRSRIPNFTDPYHQYFGPHPMQLQLMQNQAMIQQNVSKPSTCRGHENPKKTSVRR